MELVRRLAMRVREGVQAGGWTGWTEDVLHWDVKKQSAGLSLDLSKKGLITNSLIK